MFVSIPAQIGLHPTKVFSSPVVILLVFVETSLSAPIKVFNVPAVVATPEFAPKQAFPAPVEFAKLFAPNAEQFPAVY